MRTLPIVALAAVATGAFAGCGSGPPAETVTVTAPSSSSTPATASPTSGSSIVVSSPPTTTPIETSENSFVVTGTSTLDTVYVSNVGGPNDLDYPGDDSDGYPEYRVTVAADGTWSQRMPVFPGENSIFVENDPVNAATTVERTITGTGTAMPEGVPDDAGKSSEPPLSDEDVTFDKTSGTVRGTSVLLTGTVSPPTAAVKIDYGRSSPVTRLKTVRGVNGRWKAKFTAKSQGVYRFTVESGDGAIDVATRTFKISAAEKAARRKRYVASQTKTFSGSGGLTLAPFTLSKDSDLTWSSTGQLFQIFDDGDPESGGVPVNSQAASGKSFISAGRHKFQVNADGNWTITIKPR